MPDEPSDLVQGTLDMLILKTLALEPMHGYGITARLEQISRGTFRINAGSLFVALQRLHRAGLVRSEWKATENSRRAKYYILTQQVGVRFIIKLIKAYTEALISLFEAGVQTSKLVSFARSISQ